MIKQRTNCEKEKKIILNQEFFFSFFFFNKTGKKKIQFIIYYSIFLPSLDTIA